MLIEIILLIMDLMPENKITTPYNLIITTIHKRNSSQNCKMSVGSHKKQQNQSISLHSNRELISQPTFQPDTLHFNTQLYNQETTPNVVNLQFSEEAPLPKKNYYRKLTRKNEERKSNTFQKEILNKTKYHELFKERMDTFFKNTMKIGSWAKTITSEEEELMDPFCRRKIINVEKLTYPLRQSKKSIVSASTRYKYKTIIARTSRKNINEPKAQKSSITMVAGESIGKQRRSYSKSNSQIFDAGFLLKSDIKLESKNQVSNLMIPVRKPSNRKDYFVFGMSDRAGSSENKIEIYRDLLWRVNYSNGLYVHTPENILNPFKFYVGEGNNSHLIKGIIRRRFWWVQALNKNEEGINFTWTQLKINSFFSTQENGANINQEYFIVEKIPSQTNYQNIINAFETMEVDLDNSKKIFGKIDYKIWKDHTYKNQKTEKTISANTYKNRLKLYEKKRIVKIEQSKKIKMHNHLQQNFYIGNKKALFYNMKRYLELKGQDPYTILPLTFHIKKGVEDPEYLKFVSYYEQFQDHNRFNKNSKNMWIVKPGENTNRGNGITVCYTLDDIKIRLKGKEKNADGKYRTFILQKYIENPFLYNKRKFDIRHYMLLTCINGSFKAYWYEEGYIRTSSSEFNTKQTRDPLIHLTNDAIQKHTTDYGKYEKANKLSYTDFQKYLDQLPNTRKEKYNFFEQILPKMKQYAIEAVKATYSILDENRKKHNFQLLGLDFMIDQDFKPWLIEVNTNPCLELCCPLLSRIIPSVIQNLFRICVDPLFPPPENWPINKKPFFSEDSLADNKFQIIFDQNAEGKEVQNYYQGQDKIDKQMGKIEEDDEIFQNDGDENWDGCE